MPSIVLRLDGDGSWPDLKNKTVHHVQTDIAIVALPHGMRSGKPSVAIRVDLPNGEVVVAETSLALFLTAADGLKAKYGDPRK